MAVSPQGLGTSRPESGFRFIVKEERIVVRRIEGRVIIAQESRFQLLDDDGVAHLFILGPAAEIEPSQLAPLSKGQRRVTVSYEAGRDIVAHVARSIGWGEAP